MGTRTKNLGLYKPSANDYYNVETDQNENFDKIDKKFGEVDKTKLDKGSYGGDADDLKREIDGKEPAFSKNSGFNKEKTSEYKSGKDAEKLFTQEGANNLYKEVENEISNKVSKDGDTMTADLTLINDGGISFNVRGNGNSGYFGQDGNDYIALSNNISRKMLKLFNDGNAEYPATNIEIPNIDEVVKAINYLHNNSFKINPKKLNSGDNLDELFNEGVYYGTTGVKGAPSNSGHNIENLGRYIVYVLGATNDNSRDLKAQLLIPTDGSTGNVMYMRNSGGGKNKYAYGWVQVATTGKNSILMGAMGIMEVKYIQDVGTKEEGKGYIDKDTKALYIAVKTNSDTTVTNNFMKADNISNSSQVKFSTSNRWIIKEYKGGYIELFGRRNVAFNTTTEYVFGLPINVTTDSIILVSSWDTANENQFSAELSNSSSGGYFNRVIAKRWGKIASGSTDINIHIIGRKY